ncbi:hypothetical protein C8R43DRAFT_1030446, partial [Mycena crocata]
MAWIPLSYDGLTIPHRISTFLFNFDSTSPHFTPDRAWPSRGTVSANILAEFQSDVNAIYASTTAAFERVRSHTAMTALRLPLRAVERTYASLLALRVNFLTRRDVLEYVACLKRSVAELQGFLLWAKDLEAWIDPHAARERQDYKMRGVVCEDLAIYTTLCRLGIPAWCFVSNFPSVPRHSGRIVTRGFPGWSSSRLHNKALFFYPPLVPDVREFELVARGYGVRIDKMHRDKGYRKDLDEMEATYEEINRKRYLAPGTLEFNRTLYLVL